MQTNLAHSKYLAEFNEILRKIVFNEPIKEYTKKEVKASQVEEKKED